MKTVTKTALANIRQNKGRNLLSGIAITLTTLLICIILTVGYSTISVGREAVRQHSPTWHAMYHQLSQQNADALKLHGELENVGLRMDLGQITDNDSVIMLISMDEKASELYNLKLEKGIFPVNGDDIVISQAVLIELEINAGIGDRITIPVQLYDSEGLGYVNDESFLICGFLETTQANENEKMYSAICSMEYMEQHFPVESREYRAVFQIAGAEEMTTDAIEHKANTIAPYFGVTEYDVVINAEYLMANYTDPSVLTGIVVVILVVVFTGVLAIYSIYYVSMIPKVQEYGRLKAIGASRKQIRQIVFREGMLAAGIAIPVGLLISTILSRPIILGIYQSVDIENPINELQLHILETSQVPLFHWWIYAITIGAALLTIYLSLRRPMKIAERISPVDAMCYIGEAASNKKLRKGYRALNLLRLTKANLSRNIKRTAITIITLGATGVLFMVVSTVLSCARPEEIARQGISSDFRISIDNREGDKMNPDLAWSAIQQNNPMDDTFLEQIRRLPGVENVSVKTYLQGKLPDHFNGNEVWTASLKGLDYTNAKEIEKGIIDGHVTYEELESGDKVIMNDIMLNWFPQLKAGDSIRMLLDIGNQTVEKTFTIAAIGQYSTGFAGYGFLIPTSVLKQLNPNNLNYTCDITVSQEKKTETYEALQAMADSTGLMNTLRYEDELKMWETTMQLMSVCCYTFLIILGGIGIMSLINTISNSIYARKREFGIMQAIALSNKQLLHMLQLEGIFYTLGTVLLSTGIGSLLGYGVFVWAKAERFLSIKYYHFPLLQTVLLVIAVAVTQILLTYIITSNFKKTSIIDRIRYSE